MWPVLGLRGQRRAACSARLGAGGAARGGAGSGGDGNRPAGGVLKAGRALKMRARRAPIIEDSAEFPARLRAPRTPRSPPGRNRAPCPRPRTPWDSWFEIDVGERRYAHPAVRMQRDLLLHEPVGRTRQEANAMITASASMVSSVPDTTSGMRRPRVRGTQGASRPAFTPRTRPSRRFRSAAC